MLEKFDNKMIRLETIYGDTFEGIGSYYGKEYNEHEYGVDEDSIVMSHIMTYESQIKSIEEIESFSSNYCKLEEVVIEDGIDIIDEVIESDDDISIYRLLLCIEDKIDCFKNNSEFIKLLDYLIKYNEDKEIINKAIYIKSRINI